MALLALGACEKKPAPVPKPEPRETPRPVVLRNFEKGIVKMKREAPTAQDAARARRAMPGLIAIAETRALKAPTSEQTCAAWDRVAANAIRQNDPALVHLWGTLAEKRCAPSGRATRYWEEK